MIGDCRGHYGLPRAYCGGYAGGIHARRDFSPFRGKIQDARKPSNGAGFPDVPHTEGKARFAAHLFLGAGTDAMIGLPEGSGGPERWAAFRSGVMRERITHAGFDNSPGATTPEGDVTFAKPESMPMRRGWAR